MTKKRTTPAAGKSAPQKTTRVGVKALGTRPPLPTAYYYLLCRSDADPWWVVGWIEAALEAEPSFVCRCLTEHFEGASPRLQFGYIAEPELQPVDCRKLEGLSDQTEQLLEHATCGGNLSAADQLLVTLHREAEFYFHISRERGCDQCDADAPVGRIPALELRSLPVPPRTRSIPVQPQRTLSSRSRGATGVRSRKPRLRIEPLALPDDFPSHPALAAVWFARSLADSIGMLETLLETTYGGDSFKSLCRICLRLERDTQGLARYFDQNDAGLLIHRLGIYTAPWVEVSETTGTCYAEIAHHLGQKWYSALVATFHPDGITAAVHPHPLNWADVDFAEGITRLTTALKAIPVLDLDKLGTALLTEQRLVADKLQPPQGAATAAAMLPQIGRSESVGRRSKGGRTPKFPGLAQFKAQCQQTEAGITHRQIADAWNETHPNDGVTARDVSDAGRQRPDRSSAQRSAKKPQKRLP
jgi:hypothetical protein